MKGYRAINDNDYGLPDDGGLYDAIASRIGNMDDDEIQEYRDMYLERLAGNEYKEDDFMLWLDDIIAEEILSR